VGNREHAIGSILAARYRIGCQSEGPKWVHCAPSGGLQVGGSRSGYAGAIVDAWTQDCFTALHVVAFRGAEKVVVQVLLRNKTFMEAEARWPRSDNRDEKADGLADTNGTEFLSKRLYQPLLEQPMVAHGEAKVQRALTARQLAESSGHVEIQRLLGMRCADP